MRINDTNFPYPLLTSDNDDFIDSKFRCDITESIINDDHNTLDLKIEFLLENKDIERYIKYRKAKYLVHIESPSTLYAKSYTFTDTTGFISVDLTKLGHNLEVCCFIVATDDLQNYSISNFHDDFQNEIFKIKKGSVLAIGAEVTIDLHRNSPEKIESIFILNKKSNVNNGEITVNCSGEKIEISLSDKTHSKFQELQNDIMLRPILISMIVIPALTEALIYINKYYYGEEKEESLESRTWFISIKNRLEDIDFFMDENNNIPEPTKYATKLLDKPLNKALDRLSAGLNLKEANDE